MRITRTQTLRRRALPLALALAVGASGCGGGGNNNSNGLDHNDPKAVAKAYYDTYYSCGEQGAGLRWDLQMHTGGSRAEDIAAERNKGCRPTRLPAIQTFQGASRGPDIAVVGVRNPDACTPATDTVVLLRSTSGWKIDVGQSNFGPSNSLCFKHGSTH